jgi:hypothetical protein
MKVNTTALAGATQVVNQYTIWQYFRIMRITIWNRVMGSFQMYPAGKLIPDPTYYQNWINSNTIQRRSAFINDA